jgi:hypothetical protein
MFKKYHNKRFLQFVEVMISQARKGVKEYYIPPNMLKIKLLFIPNILKSGRGTF